VGAALLAWIPGAAAAQSSDTEPSLPGLEDNSFLIEEAYNQDPGIIQEIQLFIWDWRAGSWTYSFTQEWPVCGIRNQFSYTLQAARVQRDDGRKTAGLGDLALNYRYQLVGDGEAEVAVAPRLSLLIPSGSFRSELGSGAVGLQSLVPVSVRMSPRFVAHGNVGLTWIPRARDSEGARADLLVPLVGGSVIWLARPTFNLLFEALWQRVQTVTGEGIHDSLTLFTLNPGGRYAWNFSSGLQIVAGASAPIFFRDGRVTPSLLLYLSFEHPW
jgi:hypothetical protein